MTNIGKSIFQLFRACELALGACIISMAQDSPSRIGFFPSWFDVDVWLFLMWWSCIFLGGLSLVTGILGLILCAVDVDWAFCDYRNTK